MNENKFLREIEIRANLPRDNALNVAIAVLQELHDRLTPKEANDLAAQLPGYFKTQWHSFDAPGGDVRRTHKRDFVRHIAEAAEVDEAEAARALVGTFRALQVLLASSSRLEGEAWDVLSQLPKDLKRVWVEAAAMPRAPKKGARAMSH